MDKRQGLDRGQVYLHNASTRLGDGGDVALKLLAVGKGILGCCRILLCDREGR